MSAGTSVAIHVRLKYELCLSLATYHCHSMLLKTHVKPFEMDNTLGTKFTSRPERFTCNMEPSGEAEQAPRLKQIDV